MSALHRIDLGFPALLEFRGPDALRFLNGQITQDVRLVTGKSISLPACVTDAKGKLQFRVTVCEAESGVFRIAGIPGSAEALEARLTRYLIADDVEVADLTGKFRLLHFTGGGVPVPAGVLARAADRYGVAGVDWQVPADLLLECGVPVLEGGALEVLRIENGIPAWGAELAEGLLPPEAGLDATDVSYRKGCYIGQEVISRIKSAGKVNKRLTRFLLDAEASFSPGLLEDGAGEITSISPQADGGHRHALGFLKRSADAESLTFRAADGIARPVRVARD